MGLGLDGQHLQSDGPALAKSGAYLQQRSSFLTSPLWAELQEVIEPVTYVDEKYIAPATKEVEASPFCEGRRFAQMCGTLICLAGASLPCRLL